MALPIIIMDNMNIKWYIAGLSFTCQECGACCAGPEAGYIWLTTKEIEMIAEHLEMTRESFQKKYIKKVGPRYSIIENHKTNDCIFLTDYKGSRGCAIYAVRPNQCRTWPFWDYNLDSPEDWNYEAIKCPGINRGRHYTFDEIEKLRTQKSWWEEDEDCKG